MPEGLPISIEDKDHRSEKGVNNALSKVFGFAEHLRTAGSLFAGASCGGNWNRPRLCQTSARVRLWLLRVLSVRVCALWILRTAMVRGRRLYWRGPVVPRLLQARLRLLGTRRIRLLRSWILQAGGVCLPGWRGWL